ncbi:arrestin domain-containing protein 3-like [Lineus longissimus]|uniref:arrestin domain-containing protein 3-like n=1 Tax=Lineus longissimus TaxID=88925 RepID=UPI002B4CE587
MATRKISTLSMAAKISVFAIAYDRQEPVYQAGELVKGHLNMEVLDEIAVRGVTVLFTGGAYCHWTEQVTRGTGDSRRTETRHYKSHEGYFTQKIDFPLDNKDHKITPGRYTHNFSYTLPQNLPSSYEGLLGKIRFQATARCEIIDGRDKVVSRPFTVIAHKDLNQIEGLSSPEQREKQKTLCCLCCESGPIQVVFRMEKTGYVPGEAIPLNAEITNNSNRTVFRSKAGLKQCVTYRAQGHVKRRSWTMADVEKPEIEPGGSCIWTDQMQVPSIPPTNDKEDCSIIDIRYELEFKIVPSGLATCLEMSVPLVIGTIPLQGMFFPYTPGTATATVPPVSIPPLTSKDTPGAEAATQAATNNVNNAIVHQPTSTTSLPDGIPPPSYAECVGLLPEEKEDNEKPKAEEKDGKKEKDSKKLKKKEKDSDKSRRTSEDVTYSPRYAFYDWNYSIDHADGVL